tara:strand:+ start:960 stop:1820 length:861 start_codon:yes stop_codon:yes gene_type:complete
MGKVLKSNEELLKQAIGFYSKSKRKKTSSIKDLRIKENEGTRMVDFDEIKETGRRRRKRWGDGDIEKWTGYDFTCLLHECYINKTGLDWNLNWLPVNNSVLRIKDRLLDLFGLCDNVLLRDYIHFFFRNYFDQFMRSRGDFYISFLEDQKVLSGFLKSYNYTGKPQQATKKQVSMKEVEVSNEALEASFLLSDDIFLSTFGIVLVINWLILRRGFSNKEALEYALRACKQTTKMREVVDATKKFEPYPSWFPFRAIKMFLSKMNSKYPVDIKFIANMDKYDYLRNI